jgi:Sec-independent protein translocase protein TatA
MKKIACAAVLVLACATAPSLAGDWDQQTKAEKQVKEASEKAEKEAKAEKEKAEKKEEEARKKAEKKAEEPWDIAFGTALMSDYNFRGVSASDHRPAVSAYFEPRYDFSPSLQAYLNVATNSITFRTFEAPAIELLAGVRPTFGRLALDFGFWEHWLPAGRCFNFQTPGGFCIPGQTVPFVNSEPADISYPEVYGRATYYVDRQLSFGGQVYCEGLGEVRSAVDPSKGLRLVHFRRGRSLVPRHEPLPELHELEGWTCLHLEAVHPRSTLL